MKKKEGEIQSIEKERFSFILVVVVVILFLWR